MHEVYMSSWTARSRIPGSRLGTWSTRIVFRQPDYSQHLPLVVAQLEQLRLVHRA